MKRSIVLSVELSTVCSFHFGQLRFTESLRYQYGHKGPCVTMALQRIQIFIHQQNKIHESIVLTFL